MMKLIVALCNFANASNNNKPSSKNQILLNKESVTEPAKKEMSQRQEKDKLKHLKPKENTAL